MSRRLELIAPWVVLGLCLTYTAGAFAVYPGLFPDPSYGLLVEKSMRAGAPWNHVTEPNPDDIARDDTYFHTTWSPGQHVAPALFIRLGLTTGGAVRVVNILSAFLAMAGWFALFRRLGSAPVVAWIACLLIAASRTFGFSFLTYVGSDQLAFAAFPWLALAVLAVRADWRLVWVAPIVVLAGFFLKNSLAIYMTAWCMSVLAAEALVRGWSARTAALATSVIAIIAGALFVINWGYVSRGWTPMAYQPEWSTRAAVYLLPAAMPLLAGTGMDDLLSRVFANEALPQFDYKNSLVLLVPVVALTIGWGVAECRPPQRNLARVVTLIFVALVTAAFTVLLATGSGASVYLSRHYLIPGVLLLPLLVERLRNTTSRFGKGAVIAFLILSGMYGVVSYGSNWRRHYQNRGAHSDEVGIAHLSLTPRVVADLRRVDRELPAGSLVALPGPALALEFSRTRVLATSATSNEITVWPTWQGRVPNLVVVAEVAGQTPEEIRSWLGSFTSYDPIAWDGVTIDGFSFYVPEGQAVDRAWLERSIEGSRPADTLAAKAGL